MASRKKEKERLRREREERERAAADAQRRKRLIGYGAGGALALAAVVVLVVLLVGRGGGDEAGGEAELLPPGGKVAELRDTDVPEAAKAAGCELRDRRATSRDHTGNPNEAIRYDSNPPTSGRHYEVAANDGAYTEAPADPSLVHALEHGRINIWFKPTAPRQVRADLKALYDRDQGFQELLVPRPDMPFQIAASAWNGAPEPNGTGRLLGCRTATPQALGALQAFIEEHRSNGPEPVP
ncbi:MAG: DUF3105 domain-containing protein [Actinomycetota bacterium]|nr:DUF3105 domain-containing protein [Actinomycetota bacterium]